MGVRVFYLDESNSLAKIEVNTRPAIKDRLDTVSVDSVVQVDFSGMDLHDLDELVIDMPRPRNIAAGKVTSYFGDMAKYLFMNILK